MENKVEEWLEKRSQDIGEKWRDETEVITLGNCKSPMEKLFMVEWLYQVEGEPNCKYQIRPQMEIKIEDNKYIVDFIVCYVSDDEWYNGEIFFNIEKNINKVLIVEIDGYIWHGANPGQFAKEKERERILMNEGYKMMRFSGREVYKDVEKCVIQVMDFVNK